MKSPKTTPFFTILSTYDISLLIEKLCNLLVYPVMVSQSTLTKTMSLWVLRDNHLGKLAWLEEDLTKAATFVDFVD